MEKINLAEKFTLFSECWSPKIAAQVDDYAVKLVKLQGAFDWHKHDDEDEMFLDVSGVMHIDFRDRRETLHPGEFIVVPKGVEHCPCAEGICEAVVFERNTVVNTGDNTASAFTVRDLERI
ncbi:cupin domain-containing protein [Varunaivibrio sulfuroxidans]|uniref:Cupin domain n=1 Tax=Varunaivibrio sulfuroxidans TaxID=1773489 RepID=A0A4R3JE99_9PROT|nr:cupin domain-containing protein [Varunaivibrio sulfuroxidans]TCS64202.1 cupin domain [Varunaivibrio sulfuroxidans]WES31354.1 cupin domain-containing protein [Varunaivibrio sulfuroxidans]